MFNLFQLNMNELLQIAKTLELSEGLSETIDSNTTVYSYAKNIQTKIIHKLQVLFQATVANIEDTVVKDFFKFFSATDFEDFTKLRIAEHYLTELATKLNNHYLELMWHTRSERYKNLVLNNASTTLFYEEFEPNSSEEHELNQKQLQVKATAELAKKLISHLIPLNIKLSFKTALTNISRFAPAA